MSNKSFDYSTVAYVSSKSRLTVKSKKKLDELAEQVALWNMDSFISKRKTLAKRKKMNVASICTKFSGSLEKNVDPKSATRESGNLQRTPTESKEERDKIMLKNLSSVKKNAAFFEGLATPQNEVLTRGSSHMKIKNVTPFSLIKNNYTNASLPQKKAFIPLSHVLCENQSNNISPMNNCSPSFSFKNKTKQNSLINESINFDLENVDKENIFQDSESECSLPPPPSYDYDSVKGKEESFIPNNCADSIDLTYVSQEESRDISHGDKSLTMLDDICEELRRRNLLDSESVDSIIKSPMKEEAKMTVRRSLSWSDKLCYIEPSNTDTDSITDSTSESSTDNEIDNMDTPSLSESSKFDLENDTPIKTSNQEFDISSSTSASLISYKSANVELEDKSAEDSNTEYILREIIKKQKNAAKDLDIFFRDECHVIGSEKHMNAALMLIEANLQRQSMMEKVDNRKCCIDAVLELKEIQLGIKADYVLIDFIGLKASKKSRDLGKLKSLHHIIMFVRCSGDHQVQKSQVFTLVHKTEAVKLGLHFDDIQRLNIFEFVRFNKLYPEFKYNFELYCMSVCPEPRKERGLKYTPLKKLLGLSPLDTPTQTRSLFTNVGGFVVTAAGMTSRRKRSELNLRLVDTSPMTGEVTYKIVFTMELTKSYEGHLNVYSDVAGVGSWAYYECKLVKSSLRGWRVSERTSAHNYSDIPDFELPFYQCTGPAVPCNYTVCAKPNTFTVTLTPDCEIGTSVSGVLFNRRMSTDGSHKKRFMAEADTSEMVELWCQRFNDVRDSFGRWARTISG